MGSHLPGQAAGCIGVFCSALCLLYGRRPIVSKIALGSRVSCSGICYRRDTEHMAENTEKQQSWGENSIWAPLFFCVFLTIMGSFFWLHFALIPLYQVMRSSSWIPCPAVVTFSGVSLDGHARKVIVEYDYFWNDQKWQGHRYDFFLSRFEIRGGAAPDRKKSLNSIIPAVKSNVGWIRISLLKR